MAQLKDAGIQPSAQRLAVAQYVLSTDEHPSADEVLAEVQASFPMLSRATVYNTLNLFVGKKLIREVIVDPNKVFYDPNTSPHYHLFDVESGKITDIDAAAIRVSGLPSLPAGMVTEGMDIIIRVRPVEASQQ